MTCVVSKTAIICFTPWHRLRLSDGRYVFMDYHHYLGPTFYRDRLQRRSIEDWYEDNFICDALDWFCKRGCKS